MASVRGRGAGSNPPNRFERRFVDLDPDAADPEEPLPRTQFLKDASRTLIAKNESPDVGFDRSINPYRGCEHGCVYCYARPYHEYLGFSSGLDFETKILVKEDAPALLRAELSSPSWTPQTIAISGVTDAYQPAERVYRLTRGCLEVLAEFRNPALIITKNHLVTRDADVLAGLASHRAAAVVLSITTLDPGLARILEPRTSTPARRLAAIQALVRAGIPAGVNVAPIIPGLTDSEVPAILKAAATAGASFAGHTIVRLPYSVKELFAQWLADHVPDRKEKVLNRIRGVRDGGLNDPRYGSRMSGEGAYAEQITALFELSRKKAGIPAGRAELSAAAFRLPPGPQLTLF
ncbi:MAG TPA: PA0069 family radical SAM protein [Planctomycetota bacterium]|nr:PA0069 family radical SAM protein [Planctomycetota bacterium]